MKKLLISILIGSLAGIVDVIPMFLQELDWNADLSAFIQWVVLGIVINYIDIGIIGWLRGLIIAELLSIPILLIVGTTGITPVVAIIFMTAFLGSLVGHFGSKYAVNG
jgi:hypothetical protein